MEAWENVIVFGADMSSYMHIDKKRKDILILGNGPTQGLDDTTLTAEAKYHVDFTQSNRKFVLSLHYNGRNSFFFVNAIKIYQFTANASEIKNYPLRLWNISKDFKSVNMKKKNKKKTGLNGYFDKFYVDDNTIDTRNIINI